jgi:hypothetical protein
MVSFRLDHDVFSGMPGRDLQLIEKIRVELFLANEREKVGRLLNVGFLEPGACSDDRLPEGRDVMAIVDVLSAETPRDDGTRMDLGSFTRRFFEESQPPSFSRNELNVFVLRVS